MVNGKQKVTSSWQLVSSMNSTVLGAVLLFSAVQHIRNPYFFLGSVYRYELLDLHVAFIVALILPFIQLFVGVAMIANLFHPTSKMVGGLLFVIFTIVQATALFRGLSISCGCFGPSSSAPISYSSLSLVAVCCLFSWCDIVLLTSLTADKAVSAPGR